MKVYVIMSGTELTNYEERTLEGIYKSRRAAAKACKEWEDLSWVMRDGVSYDIEEWEVQE